MSFARANQDQFSSLILPLQIKTGRNQTEPEHIKDYVNYV